MPKTTLKAIILQDTDNDTQIQVEKSADEDKIRFETAAAEKMLIDDKVRAHRFGPGSAYGLWGFPQYQIAELTDILFRADLRFLNYNSKSGTQTLSAATSAGEITSWRQQIATNGGNTVQEPATQSTYIDVVGMDSAVNRRRAPTFTGTFSSDNVTDYIDLQIDSLASGRRAVKRELLDFSSVSSGNSVTFNVPGSQGGSGTFTIEYANSPSAAANKIVVDLDNSSNANSNAENLAQLTSLILNGTDPVGQSRANGGGNYDANWGAYASSGVGASSGFTSGVDAVVSSTASKLDIFATTKGTDSSIANNIQITNTAGTIRTGSDDTPLSKGLAVNGHSADTFKWKISTAGSYTEGVQITGGAQSLGSTGVSVNFDRTTGFSLGTGIGGSVQDSWRWYKVRNDLPKTLFNSDFDTRVEMQNGETHKFVIDFGGVRPYGVSYYDNRKYGVVYPQGELTNTFYFNFQNFTSVSYRGYYASSYPEAGSFPHAGWKTTSDTAYLSPATNMSFVNDRLVHSVKLGTQNFLTTLEVTIVAAAETGAGGGIIGYTERTAITSLTYITDRSLPTINEPVTLLKGLDHQNLWGALEFPSGSVGLPSVSFRDGTVGSNADNTRSNDGFFMPAVGKISTAIGGTQKMTVTSTGLGVGIDTPATELHINGGLTLTEKSSDPANPAEGNSVLWMSDGTGAGDDGDIMIKITAGGVTKTVTLVDFSSS